MAHWLAQWLPTAGSAGPAEGDPAAELAGSAALSMGGSEWHVVHPTSWISPEDGPERGSAGGAEGNLRRIDGEQWVDELQQCACLFASDHGPPQFVTPVGRLKLTNCRLLLLQAPTEVPDADQVLFEAHLGCLAHVTGSVTPPNCRWLAEHQQRAFVAHGPDRVPPTPPAAGWPTLVLRLRSGGVAALVSWAATQEEFTRFLQHLAAPREALALASRPVPAAPSRAPAQKPAPRLPENIMADFQRLGVLPGAPGEGRSGWRLDCTLNSNYELCKSYPRALAVPSAASEEVIKGSANFRSSRRLPVLAWRDPETGAAICRSSQPQPGMMCARSADDEAFVECIRTAGHPLARQNPLYILDLRPSLNAKANRVKGGGMEDPAYYGGDEKAKLKFFGMDNIHAMAASLRDVQLLALRTAVDQGVLSPSTLHRVPSGDDVVQRPLKTDGQVADPYFVQLDRTKWIEYMRLVLIASLDVVTIVRDYQSSVLVHCSDGWDRTSQVTSLAALLLDPYYRTLDGFATLVDNHWLAMGHRFRTRGTGVTIEVQQPLDQRTVSSSAIPAKLTEVGGSVHTDMLGSSEVSPIFLQWLCAVGNLVEQHPAAFEFTEELLRQLAVHHSSGVYDNFLGDNDRERCKELGCGGAPSSRGRRCFWDAMRKDHPHCRNVSYDPRSRPGAFTHDLVDTSARRVHQWVLQDGKSRVESMKRDNAKALGLLNAENQRLREQQRLEREAAEREREERAAQMYQLQQQVRELAREKERQRIRTGKLIQAYSEDMGHLPVQIREAHPGGDRAKKRPLIVGLGDSAQVVGAEEERDDCEDHSGALDESLVIVSQVAEAGQRQQPVPRPAAAQPRSRPADAAQLVEESSRVLHPSQRIPPPVSEEYFPRR
eukprot:TRINITY_DN1466_c0_g1_i1.p1 TRINITY_DN1466_c0_g1~~TRINITY_DN1466_c0_g1_i1.p1  ORF type:complete len:885 (+),score=214.84 TRINITY_DN1466_c0_g1_i1:72-2726(+)